ncbi:hypothetical protein C0995_012262 [Termitomyces sp. Mi166|nr:hypothetical protein C0995_012262 [Termitomyces sp. Mi166\
MLPFCALGLCGYIAIFLTLRVTCGLKLDDVPSKVNVGEIMKVSWTSVPSDPKIMAFFWLCDNSAVQIALSVSTVLGFFSVTVVDVLNQPLPLSCNLQAKDSNDLAIILDQAEVTIFAASPSAPTTSIGEPSLASTDPEGSSTPLSTPTKLSGEPSLASTDTAKGSLTPLSTHSITINSTSEPTRMSSSIDDPAFARPPTSMTKISESSLPTTILSSTSIDTAAISSMPTSTPTFTTTPIGAIVGGVVGGLVGMGILIILSIIWLRRRRPPPLRRPPTPLPLPYDPNYVQPLDKTSRLAQIINEKEAAERQRDQLQTEVESARDRSSGISDTPFESGPPELIEALRQRILELEAQQRDLEHQLLPPSYSDSTSAP